MILEISIERSVFLSLWLSEFCARVDQARCWVARSDGSKVPDRGEI